ncbi:EAL domain-containing protein [Sporosarcina siberiensis]|uniref:EAL domain-containing protein n=1 Tax=Sporosarcina siberiensis TaxID=1365606 RepID=A0ABW4SDV9_9BACL
MNLESGQFNPKLPDLMKSLSDHYMVVQTDGNGVITFTNKEFLKISKWTPKRILAKTLWQMFPDTETSQKKAYEIWNTLKSGKTWEGITEQQARTGESYFVRMIAIPSLSLEDEITSVTIIELDITGDILLRNQLQEIAFIDQETGLMSRHKLETLVHEYTKEQKSFSFVYIAIDHYYTLNDLQSHGSEKELIQSFTNRLKRFFKDEPIARVGVNEFVILSAYGDWYVQGFLEFLIQQPIYFDNHALQLSVSGGIIRYPEDQKTYSHLMKAALVATKEVIDHGGGKITSLSAKLHKSLNRKAIIDRKLLTAIDHKNLQVYYQPQVDLTSGKVHLYEALVRWEDEELGQVMPDELIPIAEENGLIHKIGLFVLEEAAKVAVRLNENDNLISIAVNSSVREFSNRNLSADIISILRKTGCDAKLLELEIQENFAFQAEQESSILQQMNELGEHGVEFTLDDFGTGFASLRYMQTLPITKIKIDKVFIQSILTHPKTQQLVAGMIQFGKSMGLYVVAEGVETEDQLNLLKTMGVDAVQGYYIGVPITADSISHSTYTI